jgi:peroxiredoxin Q/BCP
MSGILKILAGVILFMTTKNAAALEAGQPAPEFEAPSTGGKPVRLADLKGSWVVLYFYPKAFTPGCTKESCSLRDGYGAIQGKGAVILGVSTDSLETQQKFKKEHNLPFDLLSDADKVVSKAYDALGFGGFMSQRKTFLIDPEGKIAHVFGSVSVGSHDEEVLAELEKLQGLSDN